MKICMDTYAQWGDKYPNLYLLLYSIPLHGQDLVNVYEKQDLIHGVYSRSLAPHTRLSDSHSEILGWGGMESWMGFPSELYVIKCPNGHFQFSSRVTYLYTNTPLTKTYYSIESLGWKLYNVHIWCRRTLLKHITVAFKEKKFAWEILAGSSVMLRECRT